MKKHYIEDPAMNLVAMTGNFALIPMLGVILIEMVLPFILAGIALIAFAVLFIGFSFTDIGKIVNEILSNRLIYALVFGWFIIKFALYQLKIKRNRK